MASREAMGNHILKRIVVRPPQVTDSTSKSRKEVTRIDHLYPFSRTRAKTPRAE